MVASFKTNLLDWLKTKVYVKNEIDTKLQNKSDINHTHDISELYDNFDMISGIQEVLNEKADKSVVTTSVNGLMSKEDKVKLDGIATEANKTVVDSSLSSSSTNPVQNKVVNSALNGKSNTGHKHTSDEIHYAYDQNVSVTTILENKAAKNHTHDDRYYTETEMNTKLNGKANSSHTHTASQISDLTVSTHTLANGAKLYKYGKIVLAVFNNYQYSGKTPYVWTDIFNIPSAYKPISTDNIYGHWSSSTGQIVAGSNKISMYPPQSSGGVFGHILWITS